MPHRPALRLLTAAGLTAVAALAAGCSPSVDVTPTTPTGVAASQCADLLDVLPGSVAGHDATDVRPEGSPAAAWGDPAIVLRCGVEAPSNLRRASPCFEISGVGWFAEVDGREYDGSFAVAEPVTFTTITQSTHIEVVVPPDYHPAAGVLAELAGPVTQATRAVDPCV